MQQAESGVIRMSQQRDYLPRIIFDDKPSPWLTRSHFSPLHGFEAVDFLHDSPVLESDVDTTDRYSDLDQRIQSLESTIAEQTDLLLECLSRITDLTEMLSDSYSTHSTSISSITIEDDEIPLRIPILVILQEDEDEVGARVPEFSASGFGDTEAEAVAELKSELGSLYAELMNTPVELLGVLPRRWKQGLSSLVIPVGE